MSVAKFIESQINVQIRLRRLCIYAYTLTFVKEIEFAKENTCQVSDRHLDYRALKVFC